MRNPFRRDRQPEERAVTSVPWNVGPTLGVTSVLDESAALGLGAVFSSTRLIADSVSTLPLRGFRRQGEDRVQMAGLPALFDALNTDGKLVPWLFQCVTSLALRGNAYGLVTSRDGYSFPTGIMWLNPTEVYTDDSSGVAVWYWRGRQVPREDIVHIPWYQLPGRTAGLSPIGLFATTISTGLAAQQYGREWFDAGGFPPGTFKNVEKVVPQEVADEVRARVTTSIRTRQPLVFGADWDYTPVSVPPNEAQFIDSMKLTATQVAAIYGIPPEMVGGETGKSMTYANVEQQQINFTMFTLRPWLVKLEHAFAALLPNLQYVRFNADALIRADLKTRHEVYAIDRTIGLRSLNELRALEDLPPLPAGQGGDEFKAPAPALPAGTSTNNPAAADSSTQGGPTRDVTDLATWSRPA